jgi:hypothetical protein
VFYFVPENWIEGHEKCWNNLESKGEMKTEIVCPFMKNLDYRVYTKLQESKTMEDNIFNLSEKDLEKREICEIDIFYDKHENYCKEEDPKVVDLKKFKMNEINKNWVQEAKNITYVYKLVYMHCPIFGIQSKAESMAQDKQATVIRRCQRLVYCYSDIWYDMSIKELREYENKVNKILEISYNK